MDYHKWQVLDRQRSSFKKIQDIIVTLGTTTSVANILTEGVMMKEKSNLVSHNLKFFIPMAESTFINLCDSFEEDGPSLPNVVVPFCEDSQLAE